MADCVVLSSFAPRFKTDCLRQRDGKTVPTCRERLEGYSRNHLAPDLPFKIEPGGEANLKGYDKPVPYFLVTARET